MKLSNLMRGLEILRPHYEGGDGYCTGAEHDEFFAYATDTPLTEDEVKEMRRLGWFQADVEDGAPYDPSESWSAHT